MADGSVIQGITVTFGADLSALMDAVASATSILQGFSDMIAGFSSSTSDSLSSAFSGLKDIDMSGVTSGVESVSTELTSLSGDADSAASSFSGLNDVDISNVASEIASAASDVTDLGTKATDTGEKISEATDKSGSHTSLFSNILGGLSGIASSVGGGISSIFGGVVSGAFGIATQAVGFLKNQLSDSISVAEAHQSVMSQTAQVVRSTGDACGMSAQELGNLATSLSHVTTFSNDTIQSGENLLLTFTGIGKDVLPATTKTMLDMAQAMGGDTKGAALMLGKALNDPTTGLSALTRVGVTFSAQEKEQIKTMMAHNDVVGAQNVMLKELQTEFGGSAEAAGKTFAGSLKILNNDLQDVKQQIGTALLPVMQSFTGFVTSTAMPAVERFSGWFSNTIGPALQGFSNNVNKAFTYVGNILKSLDLSDFSDAWTDVKASVTELGQAFQVLSSRLAPVSADIAPITNEIKTLAQSGVQVLTAILWKAYEAISAVSTAIMGSDKPVSAIGAAFKQVGTILGGQFKTDLAWLGTTFNQIAGWVQSSLMPALATLEPPFMSIATTIVTDFLPAFAQIYASGHQLVESILTPIIGVLENIIPPVIQLAGLLADGLAAGFQVVGPLVKGLADGISGLVDFFTKTEVGGDLVKATLIALAIPVSLLAVLFAALAVEAIADFIASVPEMVVGFQLGAAGAWEMASGVIALTWPILAIIAVIALVILAIQHWGDIMDWFSGKAEQTRISVEQSHVKMAISQDTNTAKGAQAAINNMEKERLGILQKLKESHDETEKAELTHQYNMIASQEQAQKAKLQKAEEDKKQQLAKQKELHAEMEEAQKPWIVRMGDGIKYGFEAAWHWISDRAIDAWNWIKDVFAPVGSWFNDRWNEIKKWWGEAGQWFQEKFSEAKNGIINAFGPVGQIFQDKWKEISTAVSSAWKGIVTFSEDAWKGIVAGVKAGASAFLSALIAPFIAIGQLFIWLYGHNTFFKAFIDKIIGWFMYCLDWIKMAWTASINWLVGAWTTVVKFATDLWKQVSGAITGAVKVAWDWLVSVWTTVTTWLVGVWNTIAKFATDLWKQVSSAITGAVKIAWDWLVSVWNTVSKWLQDAWNTIAKFATDLWNKISTAVHDGWVKAVGFVTDVWNQVSAIFTNAYNTYIAGPLKACWNYVSSVFSSAWNNYISKPMTDLWNSLSKWFTDLGTHASDSGKNFIKMLVDGITSGTGSIWNAVVGIANTIWKALGFHSPAKAGPGSDADKWMPNLTSMLSNGLNSGVGQVQSASNNLASSIKTALSKLGTNAQGWSADMINQFVKGILSGVGAVGNAAAQIAKSISANLHFSKPDTGPMVDVDKWMPDFGNMLSSGLIANQSKIQSAAKALANSISVSLNPSTLNANINYAALAGSKSIQASTAAQPINVQVTPNDVYIDGTKVTDVIATRFASMIRMKGNVRGK